MTSKKKQVKYDELEHAKLIAPIIARMSNNHTKWLYTLFTIIGVSIAIDKIIIDLEGITRVVSWGIATSILSIMMMVAWFCSKTYFKIENAYRDKQSKILNCEFTTYDLKSDISKDTRRSSWILLIGWILIGLYMLGQLALMLICEIN